MAGFSIPVSPRIETIHCCSPAAAPRSHPSVPGAPTCCTNHCWRSKQFSCLCVYGKEKNMHEFHPLCQSLAHVTTCKVIPLQPWRSLLAELKVEDGQEWIATKFPGSSDGCSSFQARAAWFISPLLLHVVFLVKYMAISRGFKQTADRVGWERYFLHLEQGKEVFVFSRSLFRERSGEEREENRSTSSLGRKRL